MQPLPRLPTPFMSDPIVFPGLPASVEAQFPVLLLPVGVQTKFVLDEQASPPIRELRVRFYPDQLGVATHEPGLTMAEQQAGADYWQAVIPAGTDEPAHDLPRWRALVARYGVPRAQWLLRQTNPLSPPAVVSAPVAEGLTRPARAQGLPDRFAVLLYQQLPGSPDGAGVTGAVREQLFTTPGRPYDPATVPQPTTEFLQLTRLVQGNPLPATPLAVGPDPTATPNPLGVGGIDAGNHWTIDFDEAETVGMAVRVPFGSRAEYEAGFCRLIVVGVRAQDAAQGQQAVEELLGDHYYTDGLQLVAQGTPTNNTDSAPAGFSSREQTDAEASFALLTQRADFAGATPWVDRPDAQHLATALGLASGALPALAGGEGRDVSDAQVLNRALWPATYGYFLEQMLRPLLSVEALAWTRAFFENYVLARGPVPALRVGRQPYGVLPTTRFSAWETDPAAADSSYARQLQQVLNQLDATWTERLNPQPGLYPGTPAPGGAVQNLVLTAPVPNLLTTLSLDATSTEYYQRYLLGPVLTEALHNAGLDLDSPQGQIWPAGQQAATPTSAAQSPLYQEFARRLDPAGNLDLLRALPAIFTQTFQQIPAQIAEVFADEPAARRGLGALLDDQPLSETAPLAAFGGVRPPYQGKNYVHWLAAASFEEIRTEDFRAVADAASDDFVAPNSLFYCLLRQAVLLEYWGAARAYLAERGAPVPAADLPERELFNIPGPDAAPWSYLYGLVGGATPLYQRLRAASPALDTYLTGLNRLAELPTAQLERLLAEHLDLGSYRLDAWRLAPVTERLTTLRQPGTATAQGSHLGAFGWLEDVRPGDDSRLDTGTGDYHDPDNLGYVHAPTATHGTAAALLRQGYKSRQLNQDPTDPATRRLAVDISSRRVRAALALLEGLRAGHSLGTLLGQRFERALQQAPDPLFVQYAAGFRAAFPLGAEFTLAAGQTAPIPLTLTAATATQPGLDGAALLRAAAARPAYPYGVPDLPPATRVPAFATLVTALVAELADDLDALGDLAVGEGIYQAARGNTDRAVAVLDGLAKGQFPPAPDLAHPPQRSLTLTQRVLLHLPVLPAADTPPPGWPAALTPRAQAAPRLNYWLSQLLPAARDLTFTYGYVTAGEWQLPTYQAALSVTGMQPLDLLLLLEDDGLRAGSAFDRVLLTALGALRAPTSLDIPPAGAVLTVRYGLDTTDDAGPVGLRRVLPLLARLRPLLGGARPAQPADLQVAGGVPPAAADTGLDYPGLAARLATTGQQLQGLADALDPSQLSAAGADPRPALYGAAFFGVAEALPALAPGADLLSASGLVRQAVQARLTAAATVAPPAGTVAAALAAYAALLGEGFRPDVTFDLAAAGLDPGAAPTYAAALAPQPPESDLLRAADGPLALQEWLHGLAAVREPLNHLDKVLLIQSLLDPAGVGALPLRVAQLSLAEVPAGNPAPYWLGMPWDPAYSPPGDALSLVQWLPRDYQADSSAQAALWLDEWTETLPLGQQNTALTFHYDQPNAAAPQSMLLVVPPRRSPAPGTSWSLEDLAGAINETLDLAKKRTIEPDALAATHLATVLPAVVLPTAQQAVTFSLDLGRVAGAALFRNEPLQGE